MEMDNYVLGRYHKDRDDNAAAAFPTTGTATQATGNHLRNYGHDPCKLRARPLQTTGATLANYGQQPAPGEIFFGIYGTSEDCGFRPTHQTNKYTKTANLIVLKGSHCNLPRHGNLNSDSKCIPTALFHRRRGKSGGKK